MGKGDSRPQQPELVRSGTTALDPDSIGSELETRERPRRERPDGRVPEANQPGHHPDEEQDKPSIEDFAARARGDSRPPLDDLRRGRSGLGRVALTAAGVLGAAVGVTRALRRRG